MQIATTWDVVELAAEERLFGGMVELAVLAATAEGRERLGSPGLKRAAARLTPSGQEAAVAEYLESLGTGLRKDDHWRQALAVFADLCVESGLVRDIRGQAGPVLRRLDAILDLAQVPFAVADVQASYAALVAELLAAAAGTHAAAGDAAYAGFLGGRFGRPAGALAAVADDLTDLADLSDLTGDARACARLLNAVLAAGDCELPNTGDLLSVRIELRNAAAAATDEWVRCSGLPDAPAADVAALERRSNMLNWAVGFVTAAFAAANSS